MVSVTHSTVVTGSHNPNKQVSKNQWNEGHVITGTPGMVLGFDGDGNPTDIEALTETTADGLYQPLDSDLTAIAALSTTAFGRAFLALANEAAFKAAVNLEIGTDVQAYDATLMPAEWTINLTDNGDCYIAAKVAMTIDEGNAPIGTATLAYEKSTTADPDAFTSTTLPATLEAGAWLKVSASSVDGFVAAHLVRTA